MTRGIKTTYSRTNFRSRLEARWAMLFDGIGWKWEYEPYDLDGYIPDFLIMGERSFLVEVKPHSTYAELARVAECAPIPDGDEHPLLVVGVNPQIVTTEHDSTCHPTGWAVAGALTQWTSDWKIDPVTDREVIGERGEHVVDAGVWARCTKCLSPGVYHAQMGYMLHPCDHYDGDHYLGELPTRVLEHNWEDARNLTQWAK